MRTRAVYLLTTMAALGFTVFYVSGARVDTAEIRTGEALHTSAASIVEVAPQQPAELNAALPLNYSTEFEPTAQCGCRKVRCIKNVDCCGDLQDSWPNQCALDWLGYPQGTCSCPSCSMVCCTWTCN